MCPERLMPHLMIAALSTTLAATPQSTQHNTKASSEEPFCSFRMLDAKLSLLTNRQDVLKAAFNPASGSAPSARRTEAVRSMYSTAAEIGSIARRLERLYEGRHQGFGVRTFRLIRIEAQTVQRDLGAVTKAQTGGAHELAMKHLDERVVSLVVHSKLYQADTEQFVAPRVHGHAANRSDPKTHFKANRLHARGGVFQGLTVVPGSLVRVSGGPERVPSIT
jgi:hypothetical protein